MVNDKKVSLEDKLKEVSGSDAISAMYQALKVCNQEQNELSETRENILSFMRETQLYEDLGFDVKYYYNKKDNRYTFTYKEKEVIGFRK